MKRKSAFIFFFRFEIPFIKNVNEAKIKALPISQPGIVKSSKYFTSINPKIKFD